ncbi:MAG: hypothetical protein IJU46_02425 [Clostridia bacterium]|nr:hypothetical protein [Clostridia bacterium]
MDNTGLRGLFALKDGDPARRGKMLSLAAAGLAFALWFALNLVLCIRHEMFRDEAQAWLIASDNGIRGIMDCIWEEGHPWLYHLILRPFAAAGASYPAMRYISFAMTAAAVLVYLIKAPFGAGFRCFSVFLPFMTYYASSFARSYFLILFFGVMSAVFWERRDRLPWIAALMLGLLASVHVIVWASAGLLFFLLLADMISRREKAWRVITSVAAFAAPVALFDLPLLPQISRTAVKLGLGGRRLYVAAAVLLCCAAAFVAAAVFVLRKLAEEKTPRIASLLCSAVFTAAVTALCLISTYRLVSVTMSAVLTNIKIYSAIPVALCTAWMCRSVIGGPVFGRKAAGAVKIAGTVLAAGLVAAAYLTGGYGEALADFRGAYSGGKEMAEYIAENIPEDAVIVSGREGTVTSVIAYLGGRDVLHPVTGKRVSYTKWAEGWTDSIEASDWYPALKKTAYEKGVIYILYPNPSDLEKSYGWLRSCMALGFADRVFATAGGQFDAHESYALYRILPQAFSVPAS